MKPCSGCPFSRKIEPGALGGAGVSVYIGQAAAPFMLHCHSAPGYSPKRSRCDPSLVQCAGAAIYRANTGVAPFLPPGLLKLAEDREAVFSDPAEFICHHARVPRSVADEFLQRYPVSDLAALQRSRPTNTYHKTAS